MKILLTAISLYAAISPIAIANDLNEGATATLKAAPAEDSKIIDGAVWQCEGASCSARAVSGSVPAIYACQHVVREWGEVTSFTYMGKVFSAEKLAKCNAVIS
jgi:hypothetical protein